MTVQKHSIDKCLISLCSDVQPKFTEVIVIGNGPSALNLSFILSGHRPFYEGRVLEATNEMLHYKLSQQQHLHILEQDLTFLSEGLEGQLTNPMALLFDKLTNPGADVGLFSQSALSWRRTNQEAAIPHVVLGKGKVGGTWQVMDRSMKTLSQAFLLQMPDMPIHDWLRKYRNRTDKKTDNKKMEQTNFENKKDHQSNQNASKYNNHGNSGDHGNKDNKEMQGRVTVEEMCAYFEEFVQSKGLSDYFMNDHLVVGVRKVMCPRPRKCRHGVRGGGECQSKCCTRYGRKYVEKCHRKCWKRPENDSNDEDDCGFQVDELVDSGSCNDDGGCGGGCGGCCGGGCGGCCGSCCGGWGERGNKITNKNPANILKKHSDNDINTNNEILKSNKHSTDKHDNNNDNHDNNNDKHDNNNDKHDKLLSVNNNNVIFNVNDGVGDDLCHRDSTSSGVASYENSSVGDDDIFEGNDDDDDEEEEEEEEGEISMWEVYGTNAEGEQFCYRAPRLVLATGNSDRPNRLGVRGEGLPGILHSQSELNQRVKQVVRKHGCKSRWLERSQFRLVDRPPISPFFEHPVVIVGSGLSAADAVLFALDRGIPVIHVFEKSIEEVVRSYTHLSPLLYPEYMRVFDLMTQKVLRPGLYHSFPAVRILAFLNDKQVLIQECMSTSLTTIKASLVTILIGFSPSLSFLPDPVLSTLFTLSPDGSPKQLVSVDATSYQSHNHPGLYAMGPLVGENYVRFLGGGAFAISSDIIKNVLV